MNKFPQSSTLSHVVIDTINFQDRDTEKHTTLDYTAWKLSRVTQKDAARYLALSVWFQPMRIPFVGQNTIHNAAESK
jgi:hypothetical protein